MDRITVLSPHRDDAVFSLGLVLNYLSSKPIHLSVLNFFTRSQYAPRVAAESVDEISEIRRREDLLALRAISPELREISLNLDDAPLRPGICFGQITQVSTADLLNSEYLEELSASIQSHCPNHLLAVPLTLGNHVDHVSVLRAALRCGNRELAFYEDLPYAAEASTQEMQEKVGSIETSLGITCRPVVVTVDDALQRKQQLAALYGSQISPEGASSIAAFANEYGGGERLWVSSDSSRWQALLS